MTPLADLSADAELASRTRWKITKRLIPFLFVLYLVAYLDRVNVSFAGLEMTKELGLSNQAFGFGAGIFFVGYFLLEIPGAVIVETWSARKWIARIMVTWGILAAGTGFIQNATQFYWIRFFLGMAEAGFFPGVLVYLSHWYRAEDRAKAVAMFMMAKPASEIIGAPISALLMNVHWFDMAGWRWLLILEGLPAVLLGVVTFFYLTDRPHQAKWLKQDEKDWIERQISRERSGHTMSHWQQIRVALSSPRVWLLMMAYFASVNTNYGILMWLPKILKSFSGATNTVVIAMTAIPFVIALPCALYVSWHSDKTGERRWHAAIAAGATASAFAVLTVGLGNLAASIAMFAVAMSGIYALRGPFWAIATTAYSGTTRAAAVGLINSFGNLGGFVGPYTVGSISAGPGGYLDGLLYLSCSALASAVLVLIAGSTSKPQPVGLPNLRPAIDREAH
ncbi:MAG TPA: MFS transporter [Bryobacteraceae bacterium]|nr:MFS transporter [Bryobacteraceae bacterium]